MMEFLLWMRLVFRLVGRALPYVVGIVFGFGIVAWSASLTGLLSPVGILVVGAFTAAVAVSEIKSTFPGNGGRNSRANPQPRRPSNGRRDRDVRMR